MNALQSKFLLVAAAGVATWAFIQSSTAQTIDHTVASQSAMDDAVTEMGVRPKSSAAVDDKAKADAAMITPNSPPTEADRRAAAAMSK